MSLNDNKGRRHASIYLGDPPVSYGGGDRHSGDRGLCLVARRGIRRCPEMAEIAPSAQGPQGAIAQACQRARVRLWRMAPCEARRLDRRGSIQWCARVLRTTGDHESSDAAAATARATGGASHRTAQRKKRRRTFARKERVAFRLAGRTRSRIAQVSSSLSRRSVWRGCSACPTAMVPSASSQGWLPAQSPGISSPELKPVPTMARSKRSRCDASEKHNPALYIA